MICEIFQLTPRHDQQFNGARKAASQTKSNKWEKEILVNENVRCDVMTVAVVVPSTEIWWKIREKGFSHEREKVREKYERGEKALPQSPSMEREFYFKIFMESSRQNFRFFMRLRNSLWQISFANFHLNALS